MFLDIDKKKGNSLAAIDAEGRSITYAELVEFTNHFFKNIKKRTLIFILSDNAIGSLAGYTAALNSKIVPLIISSRLDFSLLKNLIDVYQPEFLWAPMTSPLLSKIEGSDQFFKYGYLLKRINNAGPELNDSLSLLLSTSGSTGSPKLVRHSYKNVSSNAKNVAEFFSLTEKDKPIAMLPLQYTMGLSLVTSHLYAGSTILLTNQSLTDKEFWSFIKQNRATSFTGVPFSFEILKKLRFFRMDLPDLELITQGGGKLNEQLFVEIAKYARENNKRFIATYGQTEGTARMSFLSAEYAETKIGSIGKPIPNGEFFLRDENGVQIDENGIAGELVYKGPNVTLGYANCIEDLSKGDENEGVLYTGDIARRDDEGFYYIIGRKTRFIKLYGVRYGLDEIQHLINNEFVISCHCTGNDNLLKVFITKSQEAHLVERYLIDKIGLFNKSFEVIVVDEIPRNEYGKITFN